MPVDQAVSGTTTYLLTQGVLGIMLLISLSLNWHQYTQGRKAESERLQDAKEVTKEVVTALNNNTQSNLIMAEKIEAAKKAAA